MNEETRQLRNEYFRKWRAKNKDKTKRYNHDYWVKRATKLKEANYNV